METKTVFNWEAYYRYLIVMIFFMLVVRELHIDNRWYEAFVTVLGIFAANIICPVVSKRIPVY